MTGDEPPDPFREERGGPWHYSYRQGEILFEGLADFDNVTAALVAIKNLSRDDLEYIVLERLYMEQTKRRGILGIEDWSDPPADSWIAPWRTAATAPGKTPRAAFRYAAQRRSTRGPPLASGGVAA